MDVDKVITAPKEVRVKYRCPGSGSFRFEVINERWIREPCRNARCRQEGVLTFHVWDLKTGRLVKTEYESHAGVLPAR